MRAQRKRLQHVAFDVDVTLQVGFDDVALVEGTDRAQRPFVANTDMEFRCAFAHVPFLTVGQIDRERRRDCADPADESLERRCG